MVDVNTFSTHGYVSYAEMPYLRSLRLHEPVVFSGYIWRKAMCASSSIEEEDLWHDSLGDEQLSGYISTVGH